MRRGFGKFIFADLLDFQDMRVLAAKLEETIAVAILLEFHQDELGTGIAFARPTRNPGEIDHGRKNMKLVECRFFVLKSDSKAKPTHRALN
jgi:hypothetical protein